MQEVSPEPRSRSRTPVRDAYRLWRPTPLYRARRAGGRRSARPRRSSTSTRASRPPARTSPTRAVPQAYENAQAGHHEARRPRPAPASGARRWRSRARCSGSSARSTWSAPRYDQKPYRRSMMQTWGATVHRSPSDLTESGRGAGVASDRLAGDRDLRGGRGRGAGRGHQLRARLRAQPRAAAPDRDRPGGDRAARARGRVPGRDRRLRRRRLELRRAHVPVHPRDAARREHRSATSPPSPPRARR